LHHEECSVELTEGLIDNNLEKVADALADSLVVIYGTAVACGIDISKIFHAVMFNNFNKAWTTKEMEDYKKTSHLKYPWPDSQHIFTPAVKIGHWICKNPFGKVIKSPSWKAPNLKPLIDSQIR
jgi:hypothetical protein